jgi:mRNA interferase YafQ
MSLYKITYTRKYKSSLKKVVRHKDFDSATFEKVTDTLARGEKLIARHRDHQLTGTLKEFRECHVQNDLLLVYQKHDHVLVLLLVDIGSHASLFG